MSRVRSPAWLLRQARKRPLWPMLAHTYRSKGGVPLPLKIPTAPSARHHGRLSPQVLPRKASQVDRACEMVLSITNCPLSHGAPKMRTATPHTWRKTVAWRDDSETFTVSNTVLLLNFDKGIIFCSIVIIGYDIIWVCGMINYRHM